MKKTKRLEKLANLVYAAQAEENGKGKLEDRQIKLSEFATFCESCNKWRLPEDYPYGESQCNFCKEILSILRGKDNE